MDNHSIWQDTEFCGHSSLQGDTGCQIAVIGAGLCGLLCAYELTCAGVRDIVIIDADTVCSGISAYTTAKVTVQHSMIYNKLLAGLGLELAQQYADANTDALWRMRSIVTQNKIDCDWKDCSSWLYATNGRDAEALFEEANAADLLGIRVSSRERTPLPLDTSLAIAYAKQASFHPLKFARAVYDILLKEGCRIYEQTTALAIEENTVITDKGKISAKKIIVSSHFPFVDKRGLYFAKLYQHRSYVLALESAQTLEDYYLDCSQNGLSFRGYGDVLLLGGCSHKSGHENDYGHYFELIGRATELYPDCNAVMRWSAQDCMTYDSVPYIGQNLPLGENIFIATGFNKWGMTLSAVAARIITDLITKGKCPVSDVFSPTRRDIKMQAGGFFKQATDMSAQFIKKAVLVPDLTLDDLANDQGALIMFGGKKLGVYRDKQGQIHAIEPTCTHMHCPLKWNRDERTWDCTCHGSRFDTDGQVISGPAIKPLRSYNLKIK